MLENNTRYLQIAFNGNINLVNSILPKVPANERILIEAGTLSSRERGWRELEQLPAFGGEDCCRPKSS